MGILVALIGVAIIAAVVVASFTAVLGGVIGGELEDEEEAVERWTDLWELGQLPEEPIREYLEKWHERFWLFHHSHLFIILQMFLLTYP